MLLILEGGNGGMLRPRPIAILSITIPDRIDIQM